MGEKIKGQVLAQQFGRRRKGSGRREEEPGSWKWGRARPGCWVTLVPTSEHDLEQAPLPLRATVPPAAK